MRTRLASLCFLIIVAAIPAAIAASALRGIMHDWRTNARATHDILTGRTSFDEAAIRSALQNYVADAGRIGAQITGTTPAAREFKRQFMTFGADAQAALDHLTQRAALQADFSRLMSDCQSCHDAFKD
jgi:cytochrome c556